MTKIKAVCTKHITIVPLPTSKSEDPLPQQCVKTSAKTAAPKVATP